MTDKLTAYLIAGARLTGCKVSTNVVDGYNVTLPDGREYSSQSGRERYREVIQRKPGLYGGWLPATGLTLDTLLRLNQPDLEGSASAQHYIDTGHYLAVSEDEEPDWSDPAYQHFADDEGES